MWFGMADSHSLAPMSLTTCIRAGRTDQNTYCIGCGGGYQECGQAHSVTERMKRVDLVLEDESQQYGDMEEAASITRTPPTRWKREMLKSKGV